ncbi:MAG: hypothetical protein M1832_005845 [Thelocarpon impressellum]|nr:MAG: hypothetical protein M1832_005845 [Thelocarpon impressellum]
MKLVKQLYQPGSPAHVAGIQEALQKLQRSSDGWQLADVLLSSDDEKVRFFGALTFTVKLNSDWEALDDAASKALLHSFHETLSLNVVDAVALLKFVLASEMANQGAQLGLCKEGMKCLQSWINYAHRAFVDSGINTGPLRDLVPVVVPYLAQEDTNEVAVELFTDVLSNYPKFLSPVDIRMLSLSLCSPWAQGRLASLQAGDFDSDPIQFGRFLLALGDATVQDLARSPENGDSQRILEMLHGLLTCAGYPIAEDEIIVQALEFWASFMEFMVESLFAEEEEEKLAWFASARKHAVRAIEECWAKSRIPTALAAETWDAETRKGFKDFRKDVGDLLQSSYPLLGVGLLERFSTLALASLDRGAWEDAEAALFCLNALSDIISDGETEDIILARLFGPAMFASLSDLSLGIPTKTRQTAVNLLGHYATFFERHTENLAAALNFLFQSLDAPSMATSASRSIGSLCSSCRLSLRSELGAFLQQYDLFVGSRSADPMTKERVLGAIASIVQALPTEPEKAEPIGRLLGYVQRDIQACLDAVERGARDEAKDSGLEGLQCLTSIGKGMQELDDVPIDLDSAAPRSGFWDQGSGAAIQAHIVYMAEAVVNALQQDGDIVEAACAIFRTGFAELSPGPFVFSPAVTTKFLLKSTINTPRLGLVLATACALLSSHSTDSSQRIDGEAQALLTHVVNFIHQLGDPGRDPEIAQNCVDFIGRLVPRYLPVLLSMEPKSSLEALFLFTLQCLKGGEMLPKRSAASFWASFVVVQDQPEPVQSSIDNVMQHLGPILAEALAMNVGGNAARSELDTVAEPLKKLVFKQLRSRIWLEAALFKESFPSERVSASEKRVFLQKVMNLRGAKGTNQVIKEFWLACRGTNFAYAS